MYRMSFFASKNSFPIIFRCNQIIHENNLGNIYEDPLVHWDINPGDPIIADVNYNYWGNNFDEKEDLFPPENYICDYIWDPKGLAGCDGSKSLEELLYDSGLDYFGAEDYSAAAQTFKQLIQTYPTSEFALASMHELLALEKVTNNDFSTLRNYFESFTPADSTLFDVADFLATRCNVIEKQWQPAIDWYENRIANPPSYPDSVFAVIDLGDIHLRMEADTVGMSLKSKPHFSYRFANIKPKSKAEYEANKSTLLATLPQKKQPQTQQPLSGKNGQLKQNVPNPASESTTIVYELYTEGVVEIKIFNVLGQLVINVPLNKKQRGTHQTEISLENIPDGLYEYVMYVDGIKVDAKRMVVRK